MSDKLMNKLPRTVICEHPTSHGYKFKLTEQSDEQTELFSLRILQIMSI